jgi:hypothetical protein
VLWESLTGPWHAWAARGLGAHVTVRLTHSCIASRCLCLQVDRVALGQLLWGVKRLGGPEALEAYSRWRQRDWIGTVLEMYG